MTTNYSWNIVAGDRRKLALVGLGLLLFGMSSAGLTLKRLVGMARQTLVTGQTFPNLQINDSAGKPVAVPAYGGRRSIVVVAKPSCSHCGIELGYLDKLAPAQHPGEPLVVVVEPDGSSPGQVQEFMSTYSASMTVYVDGARSLLAKYPGSRTPSLFFLDHDGVIKHIIVGERSPEYLKQQIKDFAGQRS